MGDVGTGDGTNLRARNGCDGHCASVQREELDFKSFRVLMHMDDRPNVPHLEVRLRDIGSQDDPVVFFEHF